MAEYYKCSVCDGTGMINVLHQKQVCHNCSGSGKLNWLENVMGKPLNPYDLQKRLVEEMSLKLAQKLDRELLKLLVNS